MRPVPEVLFRKLCYIFHRGFVEARLLALGKNDSQAADLADAFEILPGFLADWDEGNLGEIRSCLKTYQHKYERLSFDYLAILDMDNAQFMEFHSKW